MSIKSIVDRLFHSPIINLVIVLLIALAWSFPAFCGDIFDAVNEGDLAKVKAMLKKNPKLVSSMDKTKGSEGMTPLHFAASLYNKDIVELLLDGKADVNIKATKSFEGLTPLHFAVHSGGKDVVELLLSRGANINAKAKDGNTPLHLAVNRGGCHLIIFSVWDPKEVVELLLAHGAEVNAKNNKGETPFDFAVRCGRRELMELLRKHGSHE